MTISEIDVGTHTIFVGNVIGGDVSGAHPLLYHEGEYKSLAPRSPDRDTAALFVEP
jgi:flavin reductase